MTSDGLSDALEVGALVAAIAQQHGPRLLVVVLCKMQHGTVKSRKGFTPRDTRAISDHQHMCDQRPSEHQDCKTPAVVPESMAREGSMKPCTLDRQRMHAWSSHNSSFSAFWLTSFAAAAIPAACAALIATSSSKVIVCAVLHDFVSNPRSNSPAFPYVWGSVCCTVWLQTLACQGRLQSSRPPPSECKLLSRMLP